MRRHYNHHLTISIILSWNVKSVIPLPQNCLTWETHQNFILGDYQRFCFFVIFHSHGLMHNECAVSPLLSSVDCPIHVCLSESHCYKALVTVPVVWCFSTCWRWHALIKEMPQRPRAIFLWGQKRDLYLSIVTHWEELKPFWLMLGAHPGFCWPQPLGHFS